TTPPAAATTDLPGQGPGRIVVRAGGRGVGGGCGACGRTAASARPAAWRGRGGGGTAGRSVGSQRGAVPVGRGGVKGVGVGPGDAAGCVACIELGGVHQECGTDATGTSPENDAGIAGLEAALLEWPAVPD